MRSAKFDLWLVNHSITMDHEGAAWWSNSVSCAWEDKYFAHGATLELGVKALGMSSPHTTGDL